MKSLGILEQTCVCYSDPETICVSPAPGQRFCIAWGAPVSRIGSENTLLIGAVPGVRGSAAGLLAEQAGWKGAA